MTRLFSLSFFLLGFCLGGLRASCPLGSEGSVSGQITDGKTREALEFASVTVYPKGSDKALSGDISGVGGRFTLGALHAGTYVLEVRFIGYQSARRKFRITAENQHIDLGKLTLMPDSQQLFDVNVSAERSSIVQKPDRKVIRISKDLAAAGGNAAELMNNLPSVQVDPDGNLSLRGDENVKLFVDGKPSDVPADQLLKQIPSYAIEKIELITNPSAR